MKGLIKRLRYYLIERQSKWNLFFAIIPFIIFVIYAEYKQTPIEKGNYTIGLITKKYWPIVNAKKIMYSYKINNKNYINSNEYNNEKKTNIGKRYLVQFSLEDPDFSHIFQDIPIPDSIKEAPLEGWKELPEWAKKRK